MNVLSLFDGISCARLALERAGFSIDSYYASEIEESPILINKHHYPDTIQVGDIREFKPDPMSEIDLVIGGHSCQSFSRSGKRKGFKDERGQLVYEFARILSQLKPKNFLAENVIMDADNLREMTNVFMDAMYPRRLWKQTMVGTYPDRFVVKFENRETGEEGVFQRQLCDSARLSAQQRFRYYWTNFLWELPKDKGILLKDILNNSEEDYFNHKWRYIDEYAEKTQKRIIRNKRSEDSKAITLCTGSRSLGANGSTTIEEGDVVRMLTVTEMERLQTLPDDYTKVPGVNRTNRIKCLGNAFTVDVIAYILSHMN